MKVYMCLLIGVLVAGIVLWALGYHNAAALVGPLGTCGVILVTLAWVALFDSRKRWPGTTASRRLLNVLSFKR